MSAESKTGLCSYFDGTATARIFGSSAMVDINEKKLTMMQ